MPIRTCIGCRRRLDSSTLVRIRAADGRFATGPGPGRGVWVGPSPACLRQAVQGRGLRRVLPTRADASEIARLEASWPSVSSACPHGEV